MTPWKKIIRSRHGPSVKLSLKSPKLKVLTLSLAKSQGTILKLRWAWNKGKKYRVKLRNAPILVLPQVSHCLFLFLFCTLTVRFSSLMCLDIVATSSWRLLWMRNVLQGVSVRIVVSVRCRVCEWAMAIVSEKCFKLEMWRFKLQMWSVEFFEWVNGLGVEFFMKGQSNKKSWKPLKAYLHPHSPLSLYKKSMIVQEDRWPRVVMQKEHRQKEALNVLNNHQSFIRRNLQLTCRVRVSLVEPWS